MNGMNYRTFKKQINAMEKGHKIYINAINLSVNSINELRKMIENKTIAVDIMELKKYIYEEHMDDFISGKFICPQMTYIKL